MSDPNLSDIDFGNEKDFITLLVSFMGRDQVEARSEQERMGPYSER